MVIFSWGSVIVIFSLGGGGLKGRIFSWGSIIVIFSWGGGLEGRIFSWGV